MYSVSKNYSECINTAKIILNKADNLIHIDWHEGKYEEWVVSIFVTKGTNKEMDTHEK